MLSDQAGLTGQPWDFLGSIDINLAGRVIVGIFLIVWIGGILYYKAAKIDEKYAGAGTNSPATEPS